MASWVLPSDAEDREILDATRRADPSAFDLLYRNYSAAVRGLCRKLLSDNTAAADDACQETMLKAYQALPRFRPGARIWPWLSTIARNVCTDMHRDRQRVIVCAEPQVREVSPGPEEIAASRTRVRILRTSLRRVERRQRMYVYLRDAFGWSYEQIADFDHTTVPAVRSVLHRGRSTLRDTVVTVARERHEWPLPALVPALWFRARVRLFQAREWGSGWISRLDPSAALAPLFTSAAVVQTALVAMVLVGGSPIETSDVTVIAQTEVTDAAPATSAPAVSGGAPIDVSSTSPPSATASPSAAAPSVSVAVDPSVTEARRHGRDVYDLPRATGSADASGGSNTDALEVGAGASIQCPDPEDRDLVSVSTAACAAIDTARDGR